MIRWTLLFFLSLFVSVAFAQVHKWTDKNGQVHYGQRPQQNSEAVKLEVNSYQGGHESSTLVMYSTSRCGYCKKARTYFKKKGIAYTERNIETSRRAKLEYDKLGAFSVPVFLYKGQQMTGFSTNRFSQFYQSANQQPDRK